MQASAAAVCGVSSCSSRAPEHRLSSCGPLAQFPRGMYHLPRPGIEPVSPTMAGRFFITEPPGKPNKQTTVLLKYLYSFYWATQAALVVKKNLPANAGNVRDPGSIPGLGRPPGGGHGNPLQFSCLENSHGQRSLAGYSPCDHKQSVMTERLSTAYKDKSYSSHMERNLVVSGLRDCGSNTSFPLLPIHPQPCCP